MADAVELIKAVVPLCQSRRIGFVVEPSEDLLTHTLSTRFQEPFAWVLQGFADFGIRMYQCTQGFCTSSGSGGNGGEGGSAVMSKASLVV